MFIKFPALHEFTLVCIVFGENPSFNFQVMRLHLRKRERVKILSVIPYIVNGMFSVLQTMRLFFTICLKICIHFGEITLKHSQLFVANVWSSVCTVICYNLLYSEVTSKCCNCLKVCIQYGEIPIFPFWLFNIFKVIFVTCCTIIHLWKQGYYIELLFVHFVLFLDYRKTLKNELDVVENTCTGMDWCNYILLKTMYEITDVFIAISLELKKKFLGCNSHFRNKVPKMAPKRSISWCLDNDFTLKLYHKVSYHKRKPVSDF